MSVLRTENSVLGVGGSFYVTEIWKNLSPVSKNKQQWLGLKSLHEDESPLKRRPRLTTTHKVKPFLSLKRLKIFQAAKYLLQLKDILDIEYKKCAVSKVKQQKQQIIVPF